MFSRYLYLFAGPSLPADIELGSRTTVLPPVVDGDLRRLRVEIDPGAHIHIIDGVFGAAQALTVTEIGETLRAGFTMSGSTSIGALRAAEAGPLGMMGFGAIFREYSDGVRTQDADVALLHDAEGLPLTVPSVGIDALQRTLVSASDTDLIRALDRLKKLHYTERSEARVIAELRAVLEATCSSADQIQDAQAYVQAMQDAKADDARLALQELCAWDEAPPASHARRHAPASSPGDYECLLKN